jgi:glycerol-3-phosphate dehydrogenase (NAD(P)+)
MAASDSNGALTDGRRVRVAVVGAGSWGTAFARHLCIAGVQTVLLCRRPEQAEAIRTRHRNPDYLRNVRLPDDLSAAVYPGYDFSAVDLLVMSVPSKGYAAALDGIAGALPQGIGVLSLTKGVEPSSGLRLSQVLQQRLAHVAPRVAVLSGPNHAEEVSRDKPAATVIASDDPGFACLLQTLVSNEHFRAYVNEDLVGVEIASAVKNVIAIATGTSDGAGYGDNTRAALMTRGLAEIARLGRHMGADPLTFSGLAGMGDLIVTCTSSHSRNRLAGELIARGHSPQEIELEMGMVAEGLTAAPAILELSRSLGVDMPITEAVTAVVYQGKDVHDAVHDLMCRQPRPEHV